MSAVPRADPHNKTIGRELNFKPIPSPIFAVDHDPGPSLYDEVSPGHLVLKA
jgi:peptide/nickel transport system ATP-binding protein/glutathione transport system ATP-binding protein